MWNQRRNKGWSRQSFSTGCRGRTRSGSCFSSSQRRVSRRSEGSSRLVELVAVVVVKVLEKAAEVQEEEVKVAKVEEEEEVVEELVGWFQHSEMKRTLASCDLLGGISSTMCIALYCSSSRVFNKLQCIQHSAAHLLALHHPCPK